MLDIAATRHACELVMSAGHSCFSTTVDVYDELIRPSQVLPGPSLSPSSFKTALSSKQAPNSLNNHFHFHNNRITPPNTSNWSHLPYTLTPSPPVPVHMCTHQISYTRVPLVFTCINMAYGGHSNILVCICHVYQSRCYHQNLVDREATTY